MMAIAEKLRHGVALGVDAQKAGSDTSPIVGVRGDEIKKVMGSGEIIGPAESCRRRALFRLSFLLNWWILRL